MEPRRIFIPDAANRAALAAIRSLGRFGCEVTAGGSKRWLLGGASRFAKRTVIHPSPREDPSGFMDIVCKTVRKFRIGAVLPPADVPALALIERRDELPSGTRLLVPPLEALDLAHDKIGLVELAERIGVSAPQGFEYIQNADNDARIEEIGFPLVIKPRRSRFKSKGRWAGASVQIVANRAEFDSIIERSPYLSEIGFLVQEKVPGEGRGVFLLADEGKVKCVFAHRRIRERPPWGGVSTLCERAVPEPLLVEHASRLMKALRWSGIAMVEFKWDPSSRRAWLMEINGRLWGSIQLAISCGADFPRLFYEQEVLGHEVPTPNVRENVRLCWLLGDLDHFFIRFRRNGWAELPKAFADIVRTRQGCSLIFDTFMLSDPAPFLAEIAARLRGDA